jgi:acetylornithine deacetylase
MHALNQLAFELCQIPSITLEEGPVLAFLSSWLTEQGLVVTKIPVAGRLDRYNILVSVEKRPKYRVIFCTHIDTVPPFVAPRLDFDSGKLWGRGACDAKGIASAMIMALLEEKAQGHKDVAVLLTVGEELHSDGAKAANSELSGRADFVVIGEPTELRCATWQKGCVVFELATVGVPAHSALPGLGRSAVHELIATCQKMLEFPWPNSPHLGPTLLNLGLINGGEAANRLASCAQASGVMRISDKADSAIATLKSMLGPHTSLTVRSHSDPFEYVAVQGLPTFCADFGSDAPHLRDVGRLILCGPGRIDVAHTESEYIDLADLHKALSVYRHLAATFRQE